MARKILTIIALLLSITAIAQQQPTSALLSNLLFKASAAPARHILNNPDSFRCQIIYTQIDRDKKGIPHFTHHFFHVDANHYFNPASMVKMPLAFLSLEKLNEMNLPGVNKNTTMSFDSSYERQVAMQKEPSAENGKPSIAHFIKRALLISENDPYNRMYQFLGQGPINRKLQEKGYLSSRITRQFMGFSEEQNRHTNGIRFYNDAGQQIHFQPPAYNTDSFRFPPPILIGRAHINRNEVYVPAPFDFTRHNNISLEDMQQMLQAVIFPASVPKNQRFGLTEDDRSFLLQYLSQFPSETNYPKYDESAFYDNYVKFFFMDSTHRMPPHVRVFNKVGWAYGFLTDVSYVLDTLHHVDYFLSATVYVNSDGVVNDSKYDEETMGFPFFREVGRLIMDHELARKRKFQPKLNNPVRQYEKRNPMDKRPTIREADN